MNFNSVEFLLVFLPSLLCLFALATPCLRLPLLFISSLLFYGLAGIPALVGMLIAIVWGYAVAHLSSGPKALRVVLALSVPFLTLFLFKYFRFTLDSFGVARESRAAFSIILDVVLPAGISFYTLQIMSYSFDVIDGREKPEKNLLRFATFVSFFPQLIAGPILRYHELRDQLTKLSSKTVPKPDFRMGLKLLTFGLVAKVFIADLLGAFADFTHPSEVGSLGAPDALYFVFARSFQIYYDFWAYSIMAIGLGRMFGVILPVNFREPYLSSSPKEFWRRWHITLSYWLRDYVYIRMGGNRRYAQNIVIVFAVVGLWHGAGWNFVVWGLYHAVLVLAYHSLRPAWDRLPGPVAIAITFVLVSLGWPLFFMSLEDAGGLLAVLFNGQLANNRLYGTFYWFFLGMVAAWTFATREATWLYNDAARTVVDSPALHAGLFFVSLLFSSFSRTFIYFRF